MYVGFFCCCCFAKLKMKCIEKENGINNILIDKVDQERKGKRAKTIERNSAREMAVEMNCK